MSLSESERQAFLDLWASLPEVSVRRRLLARYAVSRRARRAWAWLRRNGVLLGLLAYAASMVTFAGLLFHDGYGAAAAGTVAGGVGFVAGVVWSRRASARR